jgi:hypothetical protein
VAFQHWYCERCGEENTVQYKKHADVYDVRDRIADQHYRKNRNCHATHGLASVRGGFPANRQAKKWKATHE